MRTTFSDIFTQGGQTQLHKFHMMRQVLGITFKIALWIWLLSFIGLTFMTYTWHDMWLAFCYGKAHVRLTYFNMFPKEFWDSCWIFSQKTKQWLEYNDTVIITHAHTIKFVHTFLSALLNKLFQALGISLLSLMALMGYWHYKGKKKTQTKILSGVTEVSNRHLTRLLKRLRQSSDLTLAGVPLMKDRETEHMLVVGTTGTGKSNALMELMDHIRRRGEKAVIVDSTNELFRRYYHHPHDILMNPLDRRSPSWNLWQECEEDYHLHEFAECLIPESGHDTFWVRSARSLFVETVKILRAEPSYKRLQEMALQLPFKEVAPLYQSTKVASLMNEEAEKTALSIRSTLMNDLHALDYLDIRQPSFTIQSWIESPTPSWLFLSCDTAQRALLRPFYSGWLAMAARKTMSHAQSKIWFLIDELPSLNYLPELPRALAEIRKYKGCFVIGLQNLHQLNEIYGKSASHTIQSLTGTKVLFRCGEHASAKDLSTLIGEQEIREPHESISFGAHQMRDGVSLSDHIHTKPTVSATNLMNLPNLEAYLKLPGNLPITKLKFTYTNRPFVTEGFVKIRTEKLNTY